VIAVQVAIPLAIAELPDDRLISRRLNRSRVAVSTTLLFASYV
jgi:hypothetical protein